MNLADALALQARATPSAVAIVEPGRVLDYARLDAAVWSAASALRSRGIAQGDVVGLDMGHHALHLVVAYALARLGAVQLSPGAAQTPAAREALLRRFHAATTLADADADPTWLEGSAVPDERVRAPGGDAPWRIVLTSGTTGAPRAVAQTHAMAATWRAITQSAIPLRAGDRYLAAVELAFIAGLLRCMNTLHAGGTVILPERRGDAHDLLEEIDRHRPTYLYLPASSLQPLAAAVPAVGVRLPSVRILRTGSMVASRRLRAETLERLTPRLVVSYGNNEVGTPATVAWPSLLARFPTTIGRAAPGVELEVVDGEGRRVPPGEAGEVRLRAAGMPAGYIDDPEASTQAFRDGWFHPGDLAAMNDAGALFYRGRLDERMNFTGVKLYPAEIEAALLEHPDVLEAAAFPLHSHQHQDLPVAAVVLRPGASVADLAAWYRERLGKHSPAMLFPVRSMPRSPRGKVLKRELAAHAARAIAQGRRTR